MPYCHGVVRPFGLAIRRAVAITLLARCIGAKTMLVQRWREDEIWKGGKMCSKDQGQTKPLAMDHFKESVFNSLTKIFLFFFWRRHWLWLLTKQVTGRKMIAPGWLGTMCAAELDLHTNKLAKLGRCLSRVSQVLRPTSYDFMSCQKWSSMVWVEQCRNCTVHSEFATSRRDSLHFILQGSPPVETYQSWFCTANLQRWEKSTLCEMEPEEKIGQHLFQPWWRGSFTTFWGTFFRRKGSSVGAITLVKCRAQTEPCQTSQEQLVLHFVTHGLTFLTFEKLSRSC